MAGTDSIRIDRVVHLYHGHEELSYTQVKVGDILDEIKLHAPKIFQYGRPTSELRRNTNYGKFRSLSSCLASIV